jgi:hypothetical protein
MTIIRPGTVAPRVCLAPTCHQAQGAQPVVYHLAEPQVHIKVSSMLGAQLWPTDSEGHKAAVKAKGQKGSKHFILF